MEAVDNINATALIAEMKENNGNVRKMVMDSYQDMLEEKGRAYEEFFGELESRYRSATV